MKTPQTVFKMSTVSRGLSGSLPLYVIHRYYVFVFIDRANKDACLLDTSRETATPLTDGCNNNRMVELSPFN